ncbi:MAG: alpha/beta hydrolase [Alphaproteobacteria bacterium]
MPAGCQEKSVTCPHQGGFHEMVYSDWGDPTGDRTILCVHGLTRSGRDFDRLAEVLAEKGCRVLAPDIAGRGRSGYLGPGVTYEIPQYIADLSCLLAMEGIDKVDWIGTSMGGLIAMAWTSQPAHPVRRMLLNDVGPFVPKSALQRIGEYVGIQWRFESFEKGIEHIKKAYEPFGLKTEEDWRYLAELSLAKRDDGTWTNAYDLRISEPFKGNDIEDVVLWELWDQISVPTTVFRGAESDLLSADTAYRMTVSGPQATLVEIEGCGHAPTIMVPDQIDAAVDWALRED